MVCVCEQDVGKGFVAAAPTRTSDEWRRACFVARSLSRCVPIDTLRVIPVVPIFANFS